MMAACTIGDEAISKPPGRVACGKSNCVSVICVVTLPAAGYTRPSPGNDVERKPITRATFDPTSQRPAATCAALLSQDTGSTGQTRGKLKLFAAASSQNRSAASAPREWPI